ncbi:MAG: peroxiredoxin [Candidatus Azobacteroides sp.]|nr:peroxiredoxin [Candidatus Azobacteroides sp.]
MTQQESEKTVPTMPVIGQTAPAFKAQSTQGPINFPDDFSGKWVVLFSHPSDFTPVCTSEFISFAAWDEKYREADCQLIGLSVDGISSHIAWLRTIKEKIQFNGHKNMDVKLPLIDDLSMEVAKKYGMIMPGESTTKAVRAVFFIDPKATIRAIIYYPLSLGRNFEELYRVLLALKTADEFGIATPADWHPGDAVIVPAVNTSKAANERMENKMEGAVCYDWFFCLKNLEKDTVYKKILKK